MLEARFKIEKSQNEFLNKYNVYGFKDKNSMIREAIKHFKKDLQIRNLSKSADLYAEIYKNDSELQDLTNSSIDGWPEGLTLEEEWLLM
jgi:hypothetical protein